MHSILALPIAAGTAPLFGNQWLALLVIVAGITAFMLVIAAVGRWLAATHPDAPAPTPAPAPAAAPAVETGPSPELFAAITAAVYATLGKPARIVSANVAVKADLEDARHQWASEGRRQIYSSHKLR